MSLLSEDGGWPLRGHSVELTPEGGLALDLGDQLPNSAPRLFGRNVLQQGSGSKRTVQGGMLLALGSSRSGRYERSNGHKLTALDANKLVLDANLNALDSRALTWDARVSILDARACLLDSRKLILES